MKSRRRHPHVNLSWTNRSERSKPCSVSEKVEKWGIIFFHPYPYMVQGRFVCVSVCLSVCLSVYLSVFWKIMNNFWTDGPPPVPKFLVIWCRKHSPKGEVSLYNRCAVYKDWTWAIKKICGFCMYLVKQLNPNLQNWRPTVQWYFPP